MDENQQEPEPKEPRRTWADAIREAEEREERRKAAEKPSEPTEEKEKGK